MMAKHDEAKNKPPRKAPKGYEIVVPVAIGVLALLLGLLILLILAVTMGILPNS